MKKISIIIPVFNVLERRFIKTLESLVKQTCQDFEVCISDGGNQSVEKIVNKYRDILDIKYQKSSKKLGIADNTNAALELATGDYIAFLDHDDLLVKTAVEESLKAFDKYACDVCYSDEEIVNEKGKILNQFYKPDFSNDLLYSQNYICHFLVIKKSIVDSVGKFLSAYDGAQDYDYILRVTEKTKNIYHIPKILYRWLSTPESTSTNSAAKPYADDAGLNALDAHLKRVYGKTAHAEKTEYLFVYKPVFDNLKKELIDIIIPMHDKWSLTQECVHSIIDKTKYQNYQITIIDNNSEEQLSKDFLKEIVNYDKRIRVLKANFAFNWSKLQNFGIDHSDADVFVFLNNDTIIIDENWLGDLASNALREEVGVVGPLLLYEDGTIQHAGVVIGLMGYADHIYKTAPLVHANINYVSPAVSRNVTAVTGACMAISRNTLEHIGYFNEDFIICGSDVEMCLRAYEQGYRNIYLATTRLIHLESKSRNSYIPPIDFKMSKKFYSKYWSKGDPFFNINLDKTSLIPKVRLNIVPQKGKSLRAILRKNKVVRFVYCKTKSVLRKNSLAVKVYRKIKHLPPLPGNSVFNGHAILDYRIPEIKDIDGLPTNISKKYRINILIPSLNKDKVFGGIATAMKFFDQFNDKDFAKRIIVTDTNMRDDDLNNYKNYSLVGNYEESDNLYQVVNIATDQSLMVAENDIFIATAWWTAYSIKPVIEWQKEQYKLKKYHSLIYFIQDYEPYFYAWSSRQCAAESTYQFDIPTIGVFNSKELLDYFVINNYKFAKSYYFSPILNDALKKHLLQDEEKKRKKQIIVYGRPTVSRNAFEIIEEALIKAFANRDDAADWNLLSMGEEHIDAYICNNKFLKSLGKLSLDDYAKIMEESYIGISLMVSPHPSYPPLEMSTFGVKTITNNYANKDMSYFNDNIISVKHCNADAIARELEKLMDNYDKLAPKAKKCINKDYIEATNQFEPIIESLKKDIKEAKKDEQKTKRK